MFVRVDQRSERLGAFEPGVEIQAQFASQRQIGPLAGGDDDLVDGSDQPRPFRRLAFHDDPAAFASQGGCRKPCDQRHTTALDQFARFGAQFTARWQLVGVAAAIDTGEVASACRPDGASRRLGLGEARQVEQGIGG